MTFSKQSFPERPFFPLFPPEYAAVGVLTHIVMLPCFYVLCWFSSPWWHNPTCPLPCPLSSEVTTAPRMESRDFEGRGWGSAVGSEAKLALLTQV